MSNHEPAPLNDPATVTPETADALNAMRILGGDKSATGYITCGCGCYHITQPDAVGRLEVRFACPHTAHTIQMPTWPGPKTYTNPPNDGAVLSQ